MTGSILLAVGLNHKIEPTALHKADGSSNPITDKFCLILHFLTRTSINYHQNSTH
jgi:hypothetical protein